MGQTEKVGGGEENNDVGGSQEAVKLMGTCVKLHSGWVGGEWAANKGGSLKEVPQNGWGGVGWVAKKGLDWVAQEPF